MFIVLETCMIMDFLDFSSVLVFSSVVFQQVKVSNLLSAFAELCFWIFFYYYYDFEAGNDAELIAAASETKTVILKRIMEIKKADETFFLPQTIKF